MAWKLIIALYVHSVIFKPEPVEPSQLQPGDQVFYYRKKGLYQHHGVVRENGMIQHFSKGDKVASKYYKKGCRHRCQRNSRNVRLSHLDCFLKHKGGDIYRVRYGQTLCDVMSSDVGTASTQQAGPPNEIEARCEAALCDDNYQGDYDILFNCETAARNWVTGADSHSKQYLRALALVTKFVVKAALTVP